MAVVGTAGRHVIIYQLDNGPVEFQRIESPLKFQHRCVSVFTDKKTNTPTGFALGSIEGRVAIQYVKPTNPKDNFTFKCHRSNGTSGGVQDIFAVSIEPRTLYLHAHYMLRLRCVFIKIHLSSKHALNHLGYKSTAFSNDRIRH